MQSSLDELSKIIFTIWGIEIQRNNLQRFISIIKKDEKISCIVDSIGEVSKSFEGYAFCMNDRIIVIEKKQKKIIPISSIKSIKLYKGVEKTFEVSELELRYNSNYVLITSCRHDLIEKFKNIVVSKIENKNDVLIVVHKKSTIGAILKMICEIIAFITILYILSIMGMSMTT